MSPSRRVDESDTEGALRSFTSAGHVRANHRVSIAVAFGLLA
jgi:hypothetical protein